MGHEVRRVNDDLRDEVLYGRDHDHVRIFISSRMGANLDSERKAAAEAINSVSGHQAWWWENDAPIGVLHSEQECIKFAKTSTGLVLLVAGDLSKIVRSEYTAARDGGADRYILIRDGELLPDSVTSFIHEQQKTEVVTRNFANLEELKTLIYRGLIRSIVRALNLGTLTRRPSGGGKHV